MFKLSGPSNPEVVDAEFSERPIPPPIMTHRMVQDEKAILALVSAILFSVAGGDIPVVVDKASALIREVNAR